MGEAGAVSAPESSFPSTHFSDVHLIPDCLPELDLASIDLTTSVAGLRLATPVVVNAMTGGTARGLEANRALSRAAALAGAAIAVGSQTILRESPEALATFSVVRDENPHGIIFANLPAGSSPDDAKRAADVLHADALQLHLNAAQELAMPEGDRDFRGRLAAIERVCAAVPFPVIVKEVGAGIAREHARRLKEAGVAAIDVGGAGGTDFRDVERRRAAARRLAPGGETGGAAGRAGGRESEHRPAHYSWGLPTAISLLEVAGSGLDVVAGGGIRSGLDAVKAFALGAKAVSVAAPLLRALDAGGPRGAEVYLRGFLDQIREVLLLSGAAGVGPAAYLPVVLSGLARDWAAARGRRNTQS